MNTSELLLDLDWAERRVLEIQTKLHRWATDEGDCRRNGVTGPDTPSLRAWRGRPDHAEQQNWKSTGYTVHRTHPPAPRAPRYQHAVKPTFRHFAGALVGGGYG